MSWISGFFTFVAVVKELLAIGQELWAFIQKEEDAAAKKELAKNLTNATKQASQTGDTSALENIFKSGNSQGSLPEPKPPAAG